MLYIFIETFLFKELPTTHWILLVFLGFLLDFLISS